ncbi:hypothetical protein chiPu_0001675 [Chiloscyllium punctatum]|uniref:Uncharacterized protein n=1 Tax=Chiloscyllium punctatum TaxID=137246 RepID=A0A401RYQ0_CHIPU|nr:hypothetical protein [Chiloscyllium punctatum]
MQCYQSNIPKNDVTLTQLPRPPKAVVAFHFAKLPIFVRKVAVCNSRRNGSPPPFSRKSDESSLFSVNTSIDVSVAHVDVIGRIVSHQCGNHGEVQM